MRPVLSDSVRHWIQGTGYKLNISKSTFQKERCPPRNLPKMVATTLRVITAFTFISPSPVAVSPRGASAQSPSSGRGAMAPSSTKMAMEEGPRGVIFGTVSRPLLPLMPARLAPPLPPPTGVPSAPPHTQGKEVSGQDLGQLLW